MNPINAFLSTHIFCVLENINGNSLNFRDCFWNKFYVRSVEAKIAIMFTGIVIYIIISLREFQADNTCCLCGKLMFCFISELCWLKMKMVPEQGYLPLTVFNEKVLQNVS